MIDWMKFRKVYLAISAFFIVIGVAGIIKWGFRIGIDFTGGTVIEYRLKEGLQIEEIEKTMESIDIKPGSTQATSNNSQIFKLPPITDETRVKLKENLEKNYKDKYEELRFENVGPSVGPELVKKTITALLISSALILLWVAYQFKSIKFGASAVIAMFHDTLILFGLYSLLGHFFGAEIDFLFVTAVLTILSFSVHDTIVVYDRIRESQKRGGDIYDIANKALSETMVRSLNNSFTIIFMLVALVLLGGSTTRWFASALLIGTISGTYSSPFVAVPILVTWDQWQKKLKKVR